MERLTTLLEAKPPESKQQALLLFTRLMELEMDAELSDAPKAVQRVIARVRQIAGVAARGGD